MEYLTRAATITGAIELIKETDIIKQIIAEVTSRSKNLEFFLAGLEKHIKESE